MARRVTLMWLYRECLRRSGLRNGLWNGALSSSWVLDPTAAVLAVPCGALNWRTPAVKLREGGGEREMKQWCDDEDWLKTFLPKLSLFLLCPALSSVAMPAYYKWFWACFFLYCFCCLAAFHSPCLMGLFTHNLKITVFPVPTCWHQNSTETV